MAVKTKAPADWIECPGITGDGEQAHDMRDGCWTCAPWWRMLPLCPNDHRRLTESGFCRDCRKHFDIDNRPANGRKPEPA